MKNLSFNLSEILERDQLRLILGGGPPESPFGANCGYRSPGGETWCNLTASEAQNAYNNNGGNWCCESCSQNGGSSSYC